MHQEASDEGLHFRFSRDRSRPENVAAGVWFRPVFLRLVVSLTDMFYGFTNFDIWIFDIR
jgi:hypothetical protein